MTLNEYLKSLDKSETSDFAVRCGTSVGQLKQVALNNRRAGESLAINIERETQGGIRCEDLRPDVDWAYLRTTKPSDDKAA